MKAFKTLYCIQVAGCCVLAKIQRGVFGVMMDTFSRLVRVTNVQLSLARVGHWRASLAKGPGAYPVPQIVNGPQHQNPLPNIQ